jgi:hypothetical protein
LTQFQKCNQSIGFADSKGYEWRVSWGRIVLNNDGDYNPVRKVRNLAMDRCLIAQIKGTSEMPSLSITMSTLAFMSP